jgi:site-specific recombinase XerD
MRLSELTRNFIDDFRRPSRGNSINSANKYDDDIRQFIAYVIGQGGQDSVKEFTPKNVEGFVRYCESKGRSGTSIGGKLSALSSLAKFGMRQEVKGGYALAENPVDRVERPKRVKPPERWLYRDEILALLNVEAEPNEKLALAFLLHTQLRATAAAEAKVGDLSLDGERVRLAVVEKGNNHDTFVLAPEVAEPLIASLRQREAGPKEPLLLNCQGQGYNRRSLSEMVARLARRASITRVRVGAHLFARHSGASLLGQDGASEFEIMAFLRHRSPGTAKRYTHGVSADSARERFREVLRG